MSAGTFVCSRCRQSHDPAGFAYRCQCGGLFSLEPHQSGIPEPEVSLGECPTPMLAWNIGGRPVQLKLETMQPTGSFKDRGARLLVSELRRLGIRTVVEDSSGNAGASLAAYCAAAGMGCRIFVPESVSGAKLRQITAYGAEIEKVPGTRDAAAAAVERAAAAAYYASHVYNPLFFAGVASMADEMLDQCGVPDHMVVPAGNGSLLLGLYLGFLRAGKGMPRFTAVQAANCSPLYSAFQGMPLQLPKDTMADGIASASPPRLPDIMEALAASGGDVVTVSEAEIEQAWRSLAERGLLVEKTSAVAPAALQFRESCRTLSGAVVVPMTGHGLKTAAE